MINTKTEGELGRRIEYDVEHDLFHPQNIYSDEYITPTFVEYVKQLEGKNSRYKEMCEDMKADMCGTDNKVLCDYLVRILKKYGEIV